MLMRRILVSAVALLLLVSVQSSAQSRWGVTGGVNFNTSKIAELDIEAPAGWNAGLTFLADLPFGFSLQPSLIYSQKSTNLSSSIVQNVGYLELPVSVQWGPDLLIFRPFLDVTPFVGYGISEKMVSSLKDDHLLPEGWDGKERFEYGLGIGGGINVWRLQILARYCWNFGSLYDVHGWDDLKDQISGLSRENDNFGGLTLSMAILF